MLTYYGSIAPFNGAISLLCAYFFWKWGVSALTLLLGFKIITFSLSLYLIREFRPKRFYYYMNLGISRNSLWGFSAAVDFTLFVLLMIIASLL